jgi:uncharacterized protein YbjT (DUF2867 family)
MIGGSVSHALAPQEAAMKIVVIGGQGLIGSQVVDTLGSHGHDAVAACRSTGVDAVTGEGLAQALAGADVVVDVCQSPSFEDDAVMEFFRTSTGNLLAAGSEAGVGHHVALSVVGCDLLPDSGYMRAKAAQEELIEDASIPYTIVRSTQFFEFVMTIAYAATDGDTVRLPPALIQPIAAADVAVAVAGAAVGAPIDGVVEVAGPETYRLDELVSHALSAHDDPRRVVADPAAGYFGAALTNGSLLPAEGAHLGETRFEDWLGRPAIA